MMWGMAEDPRDRLAQYMEDRRDELRLTWDQIASKGSTHAETLRQVRKNRREITKQTKRAIEIGLEWRTGSVDNILGGGTPGVLPDAADLPDLPAGDLPAQINWVKQQAWSATDRQRVIAQLIELEQEAQGERRAGAA